MTRPTDNGARAIVSLPEPPAPPPLKPLDWRGEIDVTTLTLPHMMAMTGGFGLVVGQSFAGGGSLSGLIRRMTIMPQGFVRIIIELGAEQFARTQKYGAFVFFGNGMYSEVDGFVHEPVTEENSGPWQESVAVHR